MEKLVIGIKGAGEMASGIAHCLYLANFRNIFMMEIPTPLAVRRLVSFCSAIEKGGMTIEAVPGVWVQNASGVYSAWEEKKIPVIVDPKWYMVGQLKPDVLIDAVLAKRNLGTHKAEAALVIGLGPGFIAGEDVHVLIETNRGHDLGRHVSFGPAADNTGIPGEICGYSTTRVLRSPAEGIFMAKKLIGDHVQPGEIVGMVEDQLIKALIGGIVRGLIMSGIRVTKGHKIGDIDPRGQVEYCHTISDKARTIGGAVLMAVLMRFNRNVRKS